MTTMKKSLPLAAAILLPLAMLLTRTDHFGTPVSLPDASVAVFVLAGLWLRRPWVFVALFALAAGIDVFVTSKLGVSDYCMTPAYGFLGLTYAVLFWTGRMLDVARPWRTMLAVGAALVAAFAISTLSFYAFSGYFENRTLGDYLAAAAKYAVPYVGYGLLYVAAGIAVPRLVRALRARPVARPQS